MTLRRSLKTASNTGLEQQTKGTGQPSWRDEAVLVGIDPDSDLGAVKCHILHYVCRHSVQGIRGSINPAVTLKVSILAGNLSVKREKWGVHFGCSKRTVRQAIKELIADGYLTLDCITKGQHRRVRAAWDVRLCDDPREVWSQAFVNQRRREDQEREERRLKARGRLLILPGIGRNVAER